MANCVVAVHVSITGVLDTLTLVPALNMIQLGDGLHGRAPLLHLNQARFLPKEGEKTMAR